MYMWVQGFQVFIYYFWEFGDFGDIFGVDICFVECVQCVFGGQDFYVGICQVFVVFDQFVFVGNRNQSLMNGYEVYSGYEIGFLGLLEFGCGLVCFVLLGKCVFFGWFLDGLQLGDFG